VLKEGEMAELVPPPPPLPEEPEGTVDIVVKVKFTESGAIKSLRFSPDMTVEQAMASIKNKVEVSRDREYLLFIPEQCKVMMPDKTVDAYSLQKVQLVEFRPRLQVIAVKLMDDTIKKMYLDTGAPVSEVTTFVGNKIGIKLSEEFGLQIEETNEWLEPELPLLEQFKEGQILCLRKKFFLDDANIDKDDPIKLHLVYVECKTGITTGTLPCTLEEAIELASLCL